MRLTEDYKGQQFLRTVPNIEYGVNEEGQKVPVENYNLMTSPLCLLNITDSHILFANNINGNQQAARHILPRKKYDDDNWVLYRDLDAEYNSILEEKEAQDLEK